MRVAVASALAFAALAVAPAAGATTGASQPRVTLIGDSVLTQVLWNREPLAILRSGLDMDIDIGVCRALAGLSCPYEGQRVPNVVEVVRAYGPAIAPIVVVEGGYNDDPALFADNVQAAIITLLAAGVKRIIWPDLREWQPQFPAMNRELRSAAKRHPELTVVGWNALSKDNFQWFQGDGLHLQYDGAIAMAKLIHAAVVESITPLRVALSAGLPTARVGVPYSARLVASGGTAPYRWELTSGPLPRGLRLLADGTITGTPRRAKQLALTLRLTDANGYTSTARTALVVAGSGA